MQLSTLNVTSHTITVAWKPLPANQVVEVEVQWSLVCTLRMHIKSWNFSVYAGILAIRWRLDGILCVQGLGCGIPEWQLVYGTLFSVTFHPVATFNCLITWDSHETSYAKCAEP